MTAHRPRFTLISLILFIIIATFLSPEAMSSAAEEQGNELSEISLIVEAELNKEKDEPLILIKGNTNFPDRTALYIALKKEANIITGSKARVKDGLFTAKMGPFTKKINFGSYIIEAVFMPLRQRDENVIKTLGARGEKILKVREGELEYLENTSENRVKASCELTIGVPGQIDEELIKEKQELKTYSEQLKPLYAELNAEFALHKESKEEGSFDKDGWDKWSADWRKRLADIELIFKQRKQSTLYPALPEIERNLRKICDKLSILWGLYSNELEEGSSPFSYMLMSANPENLNSSIEKLFTKTTGELEPLKKEHHSCI